MTRSMALLVGVLLTAPAQADMIDYAFKFADQPAAKAAAIMLAGQYDSVNDAWLQDHVFPNLTCWRPTQDVSGVHTPLTGFFVIVSVDTPAPIAALNNHAALQFSLNRTKREQNLPFVVKNNINTVISDIACQPLPAMRNYYPLGGFN